MTRPLARGADRERRREHRHGVREVGSLLRPAEGTLRAGLDRCAKRWNGHLLGHQEDGRYGIGHADERAAGYRTDDERVCARRRRPMPRRPATRPHARTRPRCLAAGRGSPAPLGGRPDLRSRSPRGSWSTRSRRWADAARSVSLGCDEARSLRTSDALVAVAGPPESGDTNRSSRIDRAPMPAPFVLTSIGFPPTPATFRHRRAHARTPRGRQRKWGISGKRSREGMPTSTPVREGWEGTGGRIGSLPRRRARLRARRGTRYATVPRPPIGHRGDSRTPISGDRAILQGWRSAGPAPPGRG